MRQVDLRSDVAWCGVVSIEEVDGGVQPWRLPERDRALFPGGDLLERATMPAGVRMRFLTSSGRLVIDIRADSEASPIDVLTEAGVRRFPAGMARIEVDVQPGIIEVWLPQYGRTVVRELHIDDDATCAPVARPESARWIVHGSSITQCRSAPGPTETWPAICARNLEIDHLNLGFGGQCVIDPLVARLIRDQPADLITLCLGINVFGQGTHNARSLLPALLGFLATVRDGHPGTPMQVISPIATTLPPEEENAQGLTLAAIRATVEEAVGIFVEHGDRHLHLVPGLSLLGPDDTALLIDNVHPNARGYRQIAERMLPHLRATGAHFPHSRPQEDRP